MLSDLKEVKEEVTVRERNASVTRVDPEILTVCTLDSRLSNPSRVAFEGKRGSSASSAFLIAILLNSMLMTRTLM